MNVVKFNNLYSHSLNSNEIHDKLFENLTSFFNLDGPYFQIKIAHFNFNEPSVMCKKKKVEPNVTRAAAR